MYHEKRIFSGDYLEIIRWERNIGKAKRRENKKKLSSEAQKKMNIKNARLSLLRLMNNNFKIGVDKFITLTFTKRLTEKEIRQAFKDKLTEQEIRQAFQNRFAEKEVGQACKVGLTEKEVREAFQERLTEKEITEAFKDRLTEKEVRQAFKNYTKRLRRKYPEIDVKYIYVIGLDDKTGYHIHMVTNFFDEEVFKMGKYWGNYSSSLLYENSELGLDSLANYFIENVTRKIEKEKDLGQYEKLTRKYTRSQNIEKPTVEKDIVSSNKIEHKPNRKKFSNGCQYKVFDEYTGVSEIVGLYVKMHLKKMTGTVVNKN